MLTITATLEGDKQLAVELGIAAENITDWRQPLADSAQELQKSFQLNFDSRGALFGGWPPRKAQTRRGERTDTWPLMEKTGRLRGSFYSQISEDTAVLGNRSPYFKYHQSNQPRTRLPRRVMLEIDQQRRDYTVKAFQAHIIEATRGLT